MKAVFTDFNDRDNLETTLQNINRAFAENVTPERFATLVAAVFQEGSDQVELLSAGHGPIVIYSAHDQSLQYMHAQALPLGVVPEMTMTSPAKLTLQPGDMLLLVTDGFLQWGESSTGGVRDQTSCRSFTKIQRERTGDDHCRALRRCREFLARDTAER